MPTEAWALSVNVTCSLTQSEKMAVTQRTTSLTSSLVCIVIVCSVNAHYFFRACLGSLGVLDLWSGGHWFNSQLVHCQVTTRAKLLTKQYILVPAKMHLMLCGWEGNLRSGVALAITDLVVSLPMCSVTLHYKFLTWPK